jgi:hypothetical protein
MRGPHQFRVFPFQCIDDCLEIQQQRTSYRAGSESNLGTADV